MLYIEFLVESSFAFGISEILPHCLLPFTVLDEKSEELRFSKVAFNIFPLYLIFNMLYDFLIIFNSYRVSVTSGKNLCLVHGHVLTVQKKYWAQGKCPHDEWFILLEPMVLLLYKRHLSN